MTHCFTTVLSAGLSLSSSKLIIEFMAINVPDLPTPALHHKQVKSNKCVHKDTCLQCTTTGKAD
jgi:hypothetical protein